MTWASWANPGEAERFKQFSQEYQEEHGVTIMAGAMDTTIPMPTSSAPIPS